MCNQERWVFLLTALGFGGDHVGREWKDKSSTDKTQRKKIIVTNMHTLHLCRTGSALVFTRATVILNLTCIGRHNVWPPVRNCLGTVASSTQHRCVFVVCCTQSNKRPCRYGWTATTSAVAPPPSAWVQWSWLDHTNGPERSWCCSNACCLASVSMS